MTSPLSTSQANILENNYYAMLSTGHSAKEWHDMALALEDAADRLLGIDAGHRKELLLEKAEDCHDQARKLARGAGDLYPRRTDPLNRYR